MFTVISEDHGSNEGGQRDTIREAGQWSRAAPSHSGGLQRGGFNERESRAGTSQGSRSFRVSVAPELVSKSFVECSESLPGEGGVEFLPLSFDLYPDLFLFLFCCLSVSL